MVDTFRRVLAVAMLVLALVGLAPMIPLVFGFRTATVHMGTTSYPTAAAAPANPFVDCAQFPDTTLRLKNGKTYGQLPDPAVKYFRCTNNWSQTITVTLSVENPNSTGLSFTGVSTAIAPNATQCVAVRDVVATTNASGNTVVYRATVDQTDLFAQVRFTGVVRVQSGNSTPGECTP